MSNVQKLEIDINGIFQDFSDHNENDLTFDIVVNEINIALKKATDARANRNHLENLKLWLEDNINMGSGIIFSNDGDALKTTSTEALEALNA